MEITGKVIKILDALAFTSRRDGSTIVKNSFVLETAGQYPKKVAFTVMGKDKFNGMGIAVGNSYSVFFDVESREWKGRWFTELNAWKAIKVDADGNAVATSSDGVAQTPSQQAQPSPVDTTGGTSSPDNLPF